MALAPAVKAACMQVAKRTNGIRGQNHNFMQQLSNFDFDSHSASYPPDVAAAMVAAERARFELLAAFTNFQARCTTLEQASLTAANS